MGRPVLLRILPTLGCVAGLSVALACSHAPPAEPPVAEGEPETARPAPAEPAEPLPDGEDDADAGAPEAEDQAPEGEDRGERARELDDDEILIERGTSVERDETVILIERGGGSAPPSLYEAAEKARERRARTGASRVSVTDENLHEFQGEGLTFAEPEHGADEGEEAEEEAPEDAAGAEDEEGGTEAEIETERAGGEEYWRSRLLDLRLRLREAVDELDELQDRAGSLRRSFYAQDDPYVRDGRIKPAWDRVLDRIESTRRRIAELRDELDEALEEGRRAGALPGWLREGVDLEPAPEELPEEEPSGAHEGRDPQMAEEPRDPQRVEEEPEPPP